MKSWFGRLSRSLLLTVLLLLLWEGVAQQFNGVFGADGTGGPVRLSLEQKGLEFTGSLTGNGNSFTLWGESFEDEPSSSWGTVDGGAFVFEAYRSGDQLELVVFTPLEDGSIDFDDYQVLTFELLEGEKAGTRTPEETPTAARVDTSTPNPLAAAPVNPLAAQAADPFAGTFEGDSMRLELTVDQERYEGTLHFQGSAFPVRAEATGGTLSGVFTAGGDFEFTLSREGDGYLLESGGNRYRLTRVGASAPVGPGNDATAGTADADSTATAAAGPSIPGAAGTTAAPSQATTPAASQAAARSSGNTVLASGTYGTLTEDNALAFVEALHFSLQQVGQTGLLAGTSDQQIVTALASNFAALDPESQMVLSNGRQVWNETQAGWYASTPAAQREFVTGVLVIAFGEQARAYVGGSGSGGAGGGQLGMPSADPEMTQDTMNAQGCWAAAGCDSYDPIGNDFYMDDYGY